MLFKKWLAIGMVFVAIILTLPGYLSHIYFLNFVDEDDNIVIASTITKDSKLYDTVFSQHQPSAFVISSVIQKVTSPTSILEVIKSHRLFMMGWTILWLFFLAWRFGTPVALAVIVIELVKIQMLGNLFLSEGMVLYPVIYLIAFIFEDGKNLRRLESWFAVFVFWFVCFSLTPLWPLLVFLGLWHAYQVLDKKTLVVRTIISLLIVLLILSWFISFKDYFYDALYINYQYYIPLSSNLGFVETVLKSFFSPVYALIDSGDSRLLVLIKILSVGFIGHLASIIYQKQYFKACILFMILGLSSLRYIDPNSLLYGAFHMLPYFGILVYSNFLYKGPGKKILYISIIACALWITQGSLWDKRDKSVDFHVHYSTSLELREVVKILSSDIPQTIWVEPVEYWVYWQSGASQYNHMVNYYGWMDETSPMKSEITTSFDKELPTLVWAATRLGIGPYLDNYTQFSKDGKAIDLYIRSDLKALLSPQIVSKLKDYRIEIN